MIKNQKGSTLIFTVMVIFLLTILVTAILSTAVSNFQFIAETTNQNQDYYDSDAIINSMLFLIRSNAYEYLDDLDTTATDDYEAEIVKEIIDLQIENKSAGENDQTIIDDVLNDYNYNLVDIDDYYNNITSINLTELKNALPSKYDDLSANNYNLSLNEDVLTIKTLNTSDNDLNIRTVKVKIELINIFNAYEYNINNLDTYFQIDIGENPKGNSGNYHDNYSKNLGSYYQEYLDVLEHLYNDWDDIDDHEDVRLGDNNEYYKELKNEFKTLKFNDDDAINFESLALVEGFDVYTIQSWKVID